MAAFEPLRRVSSTAHVVALEQFLPRGFRLISQPTPVAWVGEVIGEVDFREAVRMGQSVGRVVVCFVAPIAERVE